MLSKLLCKCIICLQASTVTFVRTEHRTSQKVSVTVTDTYFLGPYNRGYLAAPRILCGCREISRLRRSKNNKNNIYPDTIYFTKVVKLDNMLLLVKCYDNKKF